MEIKRDLARILKQAVQSFRIVTLLGPRQAGKTTLVRHTFPHFSYVTLESPDSRMLAQEDPRGFLARYPSPVIIDEVQRVPELLSYIQEIVDNRPTEKGQFLLTGSHQPLLREKISQSLAGRTAVLTLMPPSFQELAQLGEFQESIPAVWIHRGFLPEIYAANLDPTLAYRSYFQTYVERDVLRLINLKDRIPFERFLRMLAGRIGQLINMSSLATDVGVSSKTIGEWLSVLEASFITFRLAPYFENIGKRLIKAPKVYFSEVGLAAYLLNLETPDQVSRDPLYGSLFENMVVADFHKHRLHQGKDPNLYFFRDSHGHEVDLLFSSGSTIMPIEIKTSGTYHSEMAKGLRYWMNLAGVKGVDPTVIYSGETISSVHGIRYFHYSQVTKVLPAS